MKYWIGRTREIFSKLQRLRAEGLGGGLVPKAVLEGVVWQVIERVVSMFGLITADALVARTLPIADYGRWQFSLTLIFFFNAFSFAVGSEVTVPAFTKHPRIAGALLGTGFLVRMFFGITACLLCTLYGIFFAAGESASYLPILAITIALGEPFWLALDYFRSIGTLRPMSLIRITSVVFRVVWCFAIVRFASNASFFAFGRLAEAILVACLLVVVVRTRFTSFLYKKAIAKILVVRGLQFWVGILLMYSFLRVDRWFVTNSLPWESFAHYSVGMNIVDYAMQFMLVIIQILAPFLVFNRPGVIRKRKHTLALFSLALLLSFIGCAILYFIGPMVISLIYGRNFQDSGAVVQILAYALIPFAILAVNLQVFQKRKIGLSYSLMWASALLFSIFVFWSASLSPSVKAFSVAFVVNYLGLSAISMIFLFAPWRRRLKSGGSDGQDEHNGFPEVI